MGATLPRGPVDLPNMKTPCVSDPPPDAVRALSDRVAVKCQFIVLFDKDVERAVIRVPRVTELGLQPSTWHVQQEIQPRRFREIRIPQFRMLSAVSRRPVGRGATAFPAAIYRFNAARDLLSHGCEGTVDRRGVKEGGEGGVCAGGCCSVYSLTLPHQCGVSKVRVPDRRVMEGDDGGDE